MVHFGQGCLGTQNDFNLQLAQTSLTTFENLGPISAIPATDLIHYSHGGFINTLRITDVFFCDLSQEELY